MEWATPRRLMEIIDSSEKNDLDENPIPYKRYYSGKIIGRLCIRVIYPPNIKEIRHQDR